MKRFSRSQRGFTLIELLVVIAIIGILSAVVLASINTARMKSRDAQRKSELHEIVSALELYYNDHGSYPATGATGPSQSGPTATYSTQPAWLSALVSGGYLHEALKDPINVDHGSWCSSGNNTQNNIFVYMSDGQHFIVCGWVENTSDRGTLQYTDVPNPWNPSQHLRADNNYSNYNLVYAQ